MKKTILFALMITVVLSCTVTKNFTIVKNKKLFTQEHRMRIEKANPKNIERVQFFNDRKIVIKRESLIRNESITSGKVEFEDGVYKHVITIEKHTPAIATRHDSETLLVYFEEGDNYFVFKRIGYTGYYELFGNEQENSTTMNYYNYEFEQLEGRESNLLFRDIKKSANLTEKKTLRGVIIDN